MKKVLPLACALILCSASFASAAKLAPTQNTLQPLPPDVQPAVSENVQRTASPADIRTIENVQIEQQAAPSTQNNSASGVPFMPAAASRSTVLWIALAIAALLIAGILWLWVSFD